MNKLVTIRSNRYGLDIEFDSETEFDQLLEVLGQKFKQSGRFFKDAQMALSFSGRELTRAEEDRVLAVIRENTQIEILCIIEPNDKNEMMYRSVVEQSLSDIYKKEGIFYKGTLRKRQILEAEESIVILGDVELGAKVIAKGSVIIIGTLYGSVCAGASGDTSAYVVALSMQPKYLSIGDIVAKRQIIYQESLNIKGPKIAVIDGHTAFTGGINLADEYINAYVKYGHWKDSSILVKGEGVWSFTMLFLQMWYCDDPAALCALPRSEFDQYRPSYYHPQEFDSDGLVQPYGDSPMDNQRVGENVYLNLIYGAKDYLYITTPYLIMDSELRYALCVAAKRGVDVRFITPFVPDKALVHMTTRSGYQELVEAGIRIYEYTPGFIHSKTVVCDDQVATVGTINFDFRSLYLHFECGVWMYRTKAMKQVKADFLETLQSCREITLEDCKRVPVYRRLFWSVLRLFSPLM